jgi:hypothetical protein
MILLTNEISWINALMHRKNIFAEGKGAHEIRPHIFANRWEIAIKNCYHVLSVFDIT